VAGISATTNALAIRVYRTLLNATSYRPPSGRLLDCQTFRETRAREKDHAAAAEEGSLPAYVFAYEARAAHVSQWTDTEGIRLDPDPE
jgi:hypothetical protein